jgi:hypothetical protein
MIGIGSVVKWIAIASIVTAIGVGISKGYEYHLDQIDQAVNTAKIELALEQTRLSEIRENELRESARIEREAIEAELVQERRKVNNLQRMLLVEHDLDKLLQSKPGLILPRVNKGTEDYFKELEEITQ